MATPTMVPLSELTYKPLAVITDKLNDLFLKKFSCEIELKGPKVLSSPSGSKGSDIVYRKTLLGGLKISVWKDDMTKQDADAVVNAANERLNHGAGLALALAEAGGQAVDYESTQYIFNNGPIQTGSIAVTTGGKLPCKQIIHAVGPMWNAYDSATCVSQLEEAITNILKHVNRDNNIKSVAIPAISSGIFGFPLHQCADIIVKTVYNQRVKCDHLKEIRFVNNDDPTVNAMKTACEGVFGAADQSSGSLSIASSSARQASSSTPQTYPTQKAPYSAQFGKLLISINNVNVYLKKGCIEDQNTQIIVNSIPISLDLMEGVITRSISHKAGPGLKKEMFQKGGNVQYGAVIPTNGHNLACSYVYHAVLPNKKSMNSEKTLADAIHKCLNMAHFSHLNSISFPALGTGNLGFGKKLVAEMMRKIVQKFAFEAPRRMDVCLVIHSTDRETYKAFEDAFKDIKFSQTSSKPMATNEQKGHQASANEPMVAIITGPNKEDVQEAETWLKQTLKDPKLVTVQNNHILLFGIKEHEQLVSLGISNVLISEDFQDGRARLHITGFPGDVLHVAVELELRLMEIQEKHAANMEEELLQLAVQWFYESPNQILMYPAKANMEIEKAFISKLDAKVNINGTLQLLHFKTWSAKDSKQTYRLSRECLLPRDYLSNTQKKSPSSEILEVVEKSTQEFRDRTNEFKKANLEIVKMEKVQNKVLSAVYQSKKDALDIKVTWSLFSKMYQRVPANFRKLICRVGFHRMYQDGDDTKYGAGIYFKKNLESVVLEERKKSDSNRLIYIIQAEVVTGRSAPSKEARITLPIMGSGASEEYNSLTDTAMDPQTFVIFDSYRANPQYLFTCKWSSSDLSI
ncbi:protein mono-ADP-ribosyltransferase PARP9-like [Discoglossus pictus]